MGILNFLSGNKDKGQQCNDKDAYTTNCKRFVIKNGNRMATGSDVDIVTDPNTCQSYIKGNISLNDDEINDFENIMKMKEDQCKRGSLPQ